MLQLQVNLLHAQMGWGQQQGRLEVHHHCLHSSSSGEQAQPQNGRRTHMADMKAYADDR